MSNKRLTAERINELRKEAVRLRLEKKTLKEISDLTGLTRPTISGAYKKFLAGGWAAVENRPRGAPRKHPATTNENPLATQKSATAALSALVRPAAEGEDLWSLERAERWLQTHGADVSGRSVARYLARLDLTPPPQSAPTRPALDQLLATRGVDPGARKVLSGGIRPVRVGDTPDSPLYQLYVRDGRGQLMWSLNAAPPVAADIAAFLAQVAQAVAAEALLVLQSVDLRAHAELAPWLSGERPIQVLTVPCWATAPSPSSSGRTVDDFTTTPNVTPTLSRNPTSRNPMALTHLQRLEAESIQIMREVVAETENPVMLYSIGKDSAVMLHLAMKAFSPSVPPFPLLHVDTTWKFQEMYKFRTRMAEETGMKLLVHVNEEGRAQGINPFTHGSAIHTDIMKTEALKQALDKYGFDAAFGGARRDEEKSRAKERIFSFRTANHRWDPKNQRPEIWKLYNARKHPRESIRVFPLSNWTELDIWQYIHLENIPIVPLYYAAERPVVERDGTLIMVDDERMPLNPGEVPMMRKVRFRTLGCYPLTGAVESQAETLPEIIQEMLLTRTSERQGRMIDHDSSASMEKKKQEGYF